MKVFKDITGREWKLVVNVNTVKRVRDLAKFDLLKVVEDRAVIESLSDPITLVDVLYAACKPEADAASIDDVAFGEALGGDTLQAASDALGEEIADFFPPHRRAPLKLAMAKLRAFQDQAMGMVTARLNSPELEAEVLKGLTALINPPPPTPGSSSGSAPGASG